MKLNAKVYETIEYAKDHEYGWTVGNIVMEGDKLCYAEIADTTIFNTDDVEAMRAFLDEVENAMTQNSDDPPASIDNPIYQVAVRCS